jgi:hypothetical protein
MNPEVANKIFMFNPLSRRYNPSSGSNNRWLLRCLFQAGPWSRRRRCGSKSQLQSADHLPAQRRENRDVTIAIRPACAAMI